MAYLGRSLSNGNYLKLDDISSQFNGTDTTFNLTAGSQAFYPGSSYSILVILSGVVQEADTAYQVLNNQIIFAAPPDPSDTFYCLVLGVALGVGVPANGTVDGNKLAKPLNYNDGHLYFDSVNDRLGINTTSPAFTLDVRGDGRFIGNVSIAGNLTYEDVTNVDSIGIITARSGIQGIGIQSAGVNVAVGVITALNFIGAGNTFAVNGTTVDISIAGGGGGGSGGAAGLATATGTNGVTIVGIGTTIVAGAANSEGALQVHGNVALVDGALLTDQDINQNVFIPSGKNGLLIGPVTVGVGLTVDIASGSVLVVV